MKTILNEFKSTIDDAYQQYAKDLWLICRTGTGGTGTACFPESDDVVKNLVYQVTGRLGASIGAAVKRAKRALVFEQLLNAKKSGIDVTPSVVKNIAKKIYGRSFENGEINRVFGTKFRTAANKTTVTRTELAEFENSIEKQIAELISALNKIKIEKKSNWHYSMQRKKILTQWSNQRKESKNWKI
ncbi:hypothetical protein [Photorhabdus asymbiotica]|uniref:hypothetical protein n=1 Tax=Photorhabdus asymbiotica TaxID=291112 RepID=UPI003DA6E3AB